MKLPKLLRSLVWVFLVAMFVSCFSIPLVESLTGNFSPDPNHLPLPIVVLVVLTAISFVGLLGSLIGGEVIRGAENAGLRRFGRTATAKVLAVRETGERQNYTDPVVRIKLEVHTPDGSPFEAVAENTLSPAELGRITPGTTVSVRYDPRTKEVALEVAKKSKQDDF